MCRKAAAHGVLYSSLERAEKFVPHPAFELVEHPETRFNYSPLLRCMSRVYQNQHYERLDSLMRTLLCEPSPIYICGAEEAGFTIHSLPIGISSYPTDYLYQHCRSILTVEEYEATLNSGDSKLVGYWKLLTILEAALQHTFFISGPASKQWFQLIEFTDCRLREIYATLKVLVSNYGEPLVIEDQPVVEVKEDLGLNVFKTSRRQGTTGDHKLYYRISGDWLSPVFHDQLTGTEYQEAIKNKFWKLQKTRLPDSTQAMGMKRAQIPSTGGTSATRSTGMKRATTVSRSRQAAAPESPTASDTSSPKAEVPAQRQEFMRLLGQLPSESHDDFYRRFQTDAKWIHGSKIVELDYQRTHSLIFKHMLQWLRKKVREFGGDSPDIEASPSSMKNSNDEDDIWDTLS